jgi:predicted methyltransferase
VVPRRLTKLERIIVVVEGQAPDLLSEVAHAVRLQEGEAGVRRVLRAIGELASASTRSVSQRAGLPLPVVAAINNELRLRGLLSRTRPSKLTDRGKAWVDAVAPPLEVDPKCECCEGHGVVIPARFVDLVDELSEIGSRAPAVNLTIDQSHCDASTKLRRVFALMRYRLVPCEGMLLVGDDDLISIALALVSARVGVSLANRLTVIDIDENVLGFLRAELRALGAEVELVQHDLRNPLPVRLRGEFDVAMTDPPYTPEGATLFLSRAVEGLSAGPGRTIAFSFGPKGPQDALEVQDVFGALRLVVLAMHVDFNAYRGAGVIGSRSNLHLLGTTYETASVLSGSYSGPLYSAERRLANRMYLCLQCRARYEVGPRAIWKTVGALKREGCQRCHTTRFRPLSLVSEQGGQ